MTDPKQIEAINQFLIVLDEAGFLITTTGAAAIPISKDILQELVKKSIFKTSPNIHTFKEALQTRGEFVRIYEDGGVSNMVVVSDGNNLTYKSSGIKISSFAFKNQKFQKIS